MSSIKKFLPIIAILSVVLVIVLGQSGVDSLLLAAKTSKQEKKVFAHYESLYKKLSVETTDKKKINLVDYTNQIVILNFWASWCKPCLQEFPDIVAMKKKFGDKVFVLGINSDDENQLKAIKKTVTKYKLNFPNVADSNGKIVDDFMISAIPVSIIYNKGRVIEVSNGAKDFNSEEVIEQFKKLLK